MGNLDAIWTDVPVDIDGLAQLKKAFAAFFGHNWADVMAGAENPYPYHRDWDAYVAVTDFILYRGPTVPDLTGSSNPGESSRYNIINVIAG